MTLPLLAARRRLARPVGGNDGNTLLLCHFDGSDESTTFTDSSLGGAGSPHTLTAQGNAQLDTAQSVFGGASGLLDGAGDRITAADHNDFYFYSAPSTIDLRARFSALPTPGQMMGFASQFVNSNTRWYWSLWNNGGVYTMRFFTAEQGVAFRGEFRAVWDSPAADTWYHLAWERDTDDAVYFYVDGEPLSTTIVTAWNNPINIASNLNIGSGTTSTEFFAGWFDEFRISDVARYGGASFTPPPGPYDES